MENLSEFQERLKAQRPVDWDQLPDFALYMDQVLSYMDRQVIRLDEDDGLTASMVNNYTKNGLVPRAEGKKYGRDHLAYLTAICILKRVMSVKDMDLLLKEELREKASVQEGYSAFCESLGQALDLTAQEMDSFLSDPNLADAAIHFAILSYAAGVVSNRCVSLLRTRQDPAPASDHAREKARKKNTP